MSHLTRLAMFFRTSDNPYWADKSRGRWLIALAAVMWSTSGFFAKADVFDNWSQIERGPLLAFWRAFFASLILIPFVRRPRWSWKLIPMVLLFAAMNLTFLSSMTLGDPADTIWLQYTSPVWVFMVSVFWFKERAFARDWLMLTVVCIGLGIILLADFEKRDSGSLSYGLLSGLFFAGVVLSVRQLKHHDSAWLIALNHVVTASLLAPMILPMTSSPAGMQWCYLAGFGVLQMGVPYVLFAVGLRSVVGHEAAALTLLEPVLVPVWVFFAWGDLASWTTLTGGCFIFLGLLLRYVGARKAAFAGE